MTLLHQKVDKRVAVDIYHDVFCLLFLHFISTLYV